MMQIGSIIWSSWNNTVSSKVLRLMPMCFLATRALADQKRQSAVIQDHTGRQLRPKLDSFVSYSTDC